MNKKLNGSVNSLADAMRKVFSEAMEVGNERMDAGFARAKEDLNASLNTTNSNMQAQFAAQEKKIGQQIKASKS